MKLRQALASLALGAVAGAATAATVLLFSPLSSIDQRVAERVEQRLAEFSEAPVDVAKLGPAIEGYLVDNPGILERVSVALTAQKGAEQRAKTKALLAARRDEVFGAKDAVVVGNPDGDVTLVEFYDYNCEYCRRAVPDVAALLAEDPELRIVLRQLPILSEGSVEAAKVGLAVARRGGDYWAFHSGMFIERGQANLSKALSQGTAAGLTEESIRAELLNPELEASLAASVSLARELGINGTPSFVFADEIIPGAVGVDVLREKVANVRRCGSTRCEMPQ